MAPNETMQLYNKIGTQERRAVMRLLRAMASDKVNRGELGSICRSVSRLASAARSDDGPTCKRISGYILYYKEHYAAERKKHPAASPGPQAWVS